MTHPLAFPGGNSGFDLGNGPVKSGDKALCNGRPVIVDEVLQDGDAFITYQDDGSYDTVKWGQIYKKEWIKK